MQRVHFFFFSDIQQLIQCLSVAVSALWSNRIFSFLTCWCERPSKNSLSCREEKGSFFSRPSPVWAIFNAVSRSPSVEKLSDVCSIWLLELIEVTAWFIPPCSRHTARTDMNWVLLGSPSVTVSAREKWTHIKTQVKWCQLCLAGEKHHLASFAVAEE